MHKYHDTLHINIVERSGFTYLARILILLSLISKFYSLYKFHISLNQFDTNRETTAERTQNDSHI